MLRALWFFFQLAIVAAAAVWISSQSGTVDLTWNDYSLSGNLGVVLLGLAFLVIVIVGLFRLIGMIVSAPSAWRRRRREKNRAKAFRALTRGFVAVAAGEGKKASALAHDVRRLIPEETGLPLLLEAQAARLRGEEGTARRSFEMLLSDKDAAFFGVKGLLKSSIDAGDRASALALARTALEKNPKQPWILKTVYDLEIQNRHWSVAKKLLERVRKYEAIDADQARKDEIALLLLLAEEDRAARDEHAELKKIERAVKLDPSFSPAVVRLAEYYAAKGKQGKAASIIEKAWKQKPHAELEKTWGRLAPEPTPADPFRRLRWFEKLAALKPDSLDGKLAAAKAAIDAGLNGEARSYLAAAEDIRPTARLYRLRAELEEATGGDARMMREWLEKAASAEADCVWYCRATGDLYETWSPIAADGAFNTIDWGHPYNRNPGRSLSAEAWSDPLLIDKA